MGIEGVSKFTAHNTPIQNRQLYRVSALNPIGILVIYAAHPQQA
jgi:hypothetical protein